MPKQGKIIAVFSIAFICLLTSLGSGADVGGKSFLWRVQGKTGGTAFLFGSVHMAKASTYPLPPRIEQAFDSSTALALEADPAMATSPELQQRMLAVAFYSGTDTLQQHVSKETFELAAREMGRAGLPMEQFARVKPWFLALAIEILELQQQGFSPEYGLDIHFANEARGKKKIAELESMEYQIGLLAGLDEREQELFLRYTLKDLASFRDGMNEIMGAWQTGDTYGMERIFFSTLKEEPATATIYEKLYSRRNTEMAGKIEQYLKSGDRYFVVVGAAHLVGKEGIIDLLKRKGYRVEQL